MPTRQEILDRVREKYPQYRDISDDALATGLADKYPAYADDLMNRGKTVSGIQNEFNQYRQQQLDWQNKGFLARAGELAMQPVNMVKGLAGQGWEAAKQAGQIAINPPRQVETLVEAGARVPYDIANIGRHVLLHPENLATGGIGQAVGRLISPQKLSEADIERGFEEQQREKAFQDVRNQGLLKNFVSGISPGLGEKMPAPKGALADVIPFVLPAIPVAGRALTSEGLAAKIPGTTANLVNQPLVIGGKLSTGFRATAGDLLTSIYKPSSAAEIEKVAQLAESPEFLKPIQEMAQTGKWTDAPKMLKVAREAMDARGQQIQEFLSGKIGDAVLPTQTVADLASAAIRTNPKVNVRGLEALQDRLLERVNEQFGEGTEWTARDLFEQQKNLNAIQSAAMQKTGMSRANLLASSAEASAEDAERRAISKILDSYIKTTTGIDDNFYRAYGRLSEVNTQLSGALHEARVAARITSASGITVTPKVNTNLLGAIGDIANSAIKKVLPDDLSRLNSNAAKLYERTPKAGAPVPYQPPAQPPPLPGVWLQAQTPE